MLSLKTYNTAQEYIDATEAILEEREIENNLILGICNGIQDKSRQYKNYFFMNVFDQDALIATSIKSISKAVVAGTGESQSAMKILAEFYVKEAISLTGVFGEQYYAEEFSKHYGKPINVKRGMLANMLKGLNQIPMSEGELKVASEEDAELVAEWTLNFQEEAGLFPKKSLEQIRQDTSVIIGRGDLYKWVFRNQTVSIAAVVRKTRNFGIIGLVYTPESKRGNGYATSCVYQLSKTILEKGFAGCGLFTDLSNPTSNGIYRKIGYIPTSSFSDIEFV